MNARTHSLIDSAEKSVARLVEQCQKTGPLYPADPKAVAQVSRTSKWLLNAIAALKLRIGTTSSNSQDQAS